MSLIWTNLVKNYLLWIGSKYHNFVTIASKENFHNFPSWFSLKCVSLFPDQNYFLLGCVKFFRNTQTLIWQVKVLFRELSLDLNRIFYFVSWSFSRTKKNSRLICDMPQVFIGRFAMTKRKTLRFFFFSDIWPYFNYVFCHLVGQNPLI